jgi:hypothetical protein
MIIPTLTAFMRCDHNAPDGGCDKAVPVQLILLTSGGFAFRPSPDTKDWQVGAGAVGQFICLCPVHRQTVVQAIPDLATALAHPGRH